MLTTPAVACFMRRRAELPVGHYELLNVRAGGLRAPTLKLQAQRSGKARGDIILNRYLL